MVLLIDAGNTQIKWAIGDKTHSKELGVWMQSGSLSHDELRVASHRGIFPWRAFSFKKIVVSNVAGLAVHDQLAQSFQTAHVEWLVSSPSRAGLTNHYRDPVQLGSDRFAAAIGARALFPDQSLLVVMCGTGLTLDAVSKDGDFIGGMIAPGLKLMASALSHGTAQLPQVSELSTQPADFATDTEAGIINGCVAAHAGAIDYALRELGARFPDQAAPHCVISGGAAPYVVPSLTIPHTVVDNLVLIGLQVMI